LGPIGSRIWWGGPQTIAFEDSRTRDDTSRREVIRTAGTFDTFWDLQIGKALTQWRRVDPRDELQRRFSVTLHERSVGKVLAKFGYRKLSVRSHHPQADEKAQEAFKKLRRDSLGAAPRPRQRQADRIWFQDEARMGQQGTLTRV
jgi:hypothetical protein